MIIFTISSTTLTLDISRYPCCKTPKPFSPGAPISGAPLASVSIKRFPPVALSPAELGNRTNSSCPIICVPSAVSTETSPVGETKTLVTYSLSIEAKEQAKSKAAKKGKSASGYIQELILKAK